MDNTRLDAKLGDLSPSKTVAAVKKATLGQVLGKADTNTSAGSEKK